MLQLGLIGFKLGFYTSQVQLVGGYLWNDLPCVKWDVKP